MNRPVSQVKESGSRRCWISAASDRRVVQQAPFVQIGEAPVGDHDVGEHMGGFDNELHRLAVGADGHRQLQQTNRIPAVGHRRDDLDQAQSAFSLPLAARHVDLLGADHLLVIGAPQLDRSRMLRPALRSGPGQPYDGLAAVVRDQKGHLGRGKFDRQQPGQHGDGHLRGCRLH